MWARRCRPGRNPIRAIPFHLSRATCRPGKEKNGQKVVEKGEECDSNVATMMSSCQGIISYALVTTRRMNRIGGRKIPESPWGSPIPIGDGDGDVNRFPDGDGDGDGDRDEAEKRGWGW
ncbi:hypothetical protein Tco_1199400 [Tanacetum coccineum]